MTPPPTETLLWRGTPSQWTNFGAFVAALVVAGGIGAGAYYFPAYRLPILCALALPFCWALSRWLSNRSRVYEITTERIKVTDGLFSRRTNELELYRIRDYSVIEPFWLRLVGVGNIALVTADRTTPDVVLHAVPHAAELKDQIRAHTERMRQNRGVRDLELDPPAAPPTT